MHDTRDRLKQAALSLFLERGFAGATIAAIETKAGLAPRTGGFYRHFESKEDLAVAIALEDIIEREDEFDFDDVLPLGDTKAELLLIAKVYLKANVRQKKYYALIQEVRSIPKLAALEQNANEERAEWLNAWLKTKPHAATMSKLQLSSLSMIVFGGLLFYTTKKMQGIELPRFSEKQFIEDWASFWSKVLDEDK